MSKSSRVLFLTVGYNSTQACASVIDQFRRMAVGADVVAVYLENGLNPPKYEGLEEAEVLHYPDNPGYFGAAERYLNLVDTKKQFDWVILSNPDIEFLSPIDFSCWSAEEHFVLVPSLRSLKSNSQQNPFMSKRPSLKKLRFLQAIYSLPFLARTYDRLSHWKHSKRGHSQLEPEVYAPNGAFIVVSRSLLNLGFGFEHPSKLYCEELSLAEFCLRQNVSFTLAPEIELAHEENLTVNSVAYPQICKMKSESLRQAISQRRSREN